MSTPIWAIKGMNKVFSASNKTKGFTLKQVGNLRQKIQDLKVFDPIGSKVASAMKTIEKTQKKKKIIYGTAGVAGGFGAYAIAKNKKNKMKG